MFVVSKHTHAPGALNKLRPHSTDNCTLYLIAIQGHNVHTTNKKREEYSHELKHTLQSYSSTYRCKHTCNARVSEDTPRFRREKNDALGSVANAVQAFETH